MPSGSSPAPMLSSCSRGISITMENPDITPSSSVSTNISTSFQGSCSRSSLNVLTIKDNGALICVMRMANYGMFINVPARSRKPVSVSPADEDRDYPSICNDYSIVPATFLVVTFFPSVTLTRTTPMQTSWQINGIQFTVSQDGLREVCGRSCHRSRTGHSSLTTPFMISRAVGNPDAQVSPTRPAAALYPSVYLPRPAGRTVRCRSYRQAVSRYSSSGSGR